MQLAPSVCPASPKSFSEDNIRKGRALLEAGVDEKAVLSLGSHQRVIHKLYTKL